MVRDGSARMYRAHQCAVCGGFFNAVRRDARFCSAACRTRNSRALRPPQPKRAKLTRKPPAPPPPRDYSNRDYSYRKNPCAICGQLRWATKGSRPEGRCGPCIAAASEARKEAIKARRIKSCAWCLGEFYSEFGRIYCQESCRAEGFRAKHQKKYYPCPAGTRRGYGPAHRRKREELLAEFVEGQLCAFCDKPMLYGDNLDLDHSDPLARLRGEPGDRLTHSSCNRRDGGRRASLSKAA